MGVRTTDSGLAVYCADIGSVAAGNFAWCSDLPGRELQSGISMEALARSVADDLLADVPVALGFECPLFIPISPLPENLTRARTGEGSRPWSAGAGCGSLATGSVQVIWILRRIRELAGPQHAAFLDWNAFGVSGCGLFLWEAFVSGGGKTDGHVADATAACHAFRAAILQPELGSAVTCAGEMYSIIGAALLRTDWSTDLSLLSRSCVVVRATDASRV